LTRAAQLRLPNSGTKSTAAQADVLATLAYAGTPLIEPGNEIRSGHFTDERIVNRAEQVGNVGKRSNVASDTPESATSKTSAEPSTPYASQSTAPKSA
jgi:hypothetical protein